MVEATINGDVVEVDMGGVGDISAVLSITGYWR
jgi:Na+/citrate or Na+/malate symporter